MIRMILGIYILNFLFDPISAVAADFDPQTLVLGKGERSQEFLSAPLSLAGFRTGLGSYRKILKWNEKIAAELEKSEKKVTTKTRFGLDSFTTILGVSVSGGLGILNFGGQARTLLFWKRYPNVDDDKNIQEEPVQAENDSHEANLDIYSAQEELRGQFEKVLEETLAQEGVSTNALIDSESVWKEFKKMVAMAQEIDRHEIVDWSMTDLAFEVAIGFKVEPGVVLVSLGGDFRMRFQWSRDPKYLVLRPGEKRPLFGVAKRQDLLSEARNIEKKSNYRLSQVRIGLTADVDGDIAVAELSSLASVYVWLVPTYEDAFLDSHGKSKPLISGRHWNRVLKKVVKKSHQLTKRAERINRSKRPGQWGVNRVKVFAAADVSASAGVVSVTGIPNIEIDFDHVAWLKKSDTQIASDSLKTYTDWEFSTLRVRTRARAGFAVPWLASLSVRPMLELFYRPQ